MSRTRPTSARGRTTGRRIRIAAVLGMLATLAAGPVVADGDSPAEATAPDAVEWWSIDAGGGVASGGGWTVVSAVGQPDAGALAGSSLILEGGLLPTPEPAEPPLFADGFESGDFGAWSSVTP